MSSCQFSNSYSTEILAFEQLKFWPRTEHQILQESDKLSVLDFFACLVKAAPMSVLAHTLNFSCQLLTWPELFIAKLEDAVWRTSQGMLWKYQSQLLEEANSYCGCCKQ